MSAVERLIEKFKNDLFELTYFINIYKRKELIKMLIEKLEQLPGSSYTAVCIYSKWSNRREIIQSTLLGDVDIKQLKFIFSSHNLESVKDAIKLPIDVADKIEMLENKDTYMLHFHEADIDFGSLLISFDKGAVTDLFIDKIQIEINRFLSMLYYTRHNEFKTKRNKLLFQLSSEIHSIHSTVGILERITKLIKNIYPTYSYYFLMSHDQDSSDLPIRMIEYAGNVAESAGAAAFLNNELIIKKEEEESITKVYSPLPGSQGVYGVFQVDIPVLINMTSEDKEFLNRFSNMIGRALERTTLYQSSNRLVSDLQIISDAAHDLNKNLDRNEITDAVKKYVFESSQPDQVGFICNTEQVDTCFNIMDHSTPYFHTIEGHKFSQYIYEKLKRNPKAIFLGDFKDEGFEIPFQSLMVTPLATSGEVFGAIIVMHSDPYYFSFERFKLIQSLTQHASLAYSNAILKEQLNQIAITDYLTRLYSRSFLDELIKGHMKTNEQGVLLLMDIDDFKKINDTYGHYIGDKVLIQVADIIKSMENERVVGSRWGGEEFAIYLKNYSDSEAVKLANDIREKIMDETEPSVTVSIGTSTWTYSQEDSIESLFIRTDEALYDAKLHGKNRVSVNELCEIKG